jgi:hypothetical protein
LIALFLGACGAPYRTPTLNDGPGADVTLRTTNPRSSRLMLLSTLRVAVFDYADRCPTNRTVGTPSFDDAYLGDVGLSSDAPTATIQVPAGRRMFFLFRHSEGTLGASRLCDAEIGFVPESGKRYVLEHHSTIPSCEVVVASDSTDVPRVTFNRASCAAANAAPASDTAAGSSTPP